MAGPTQLPPAVAGPRPLLDKSLSTAQNLVKLLPTCTILTFQALHPSFSNRGECYPSNKYLTSSLIVLCSISCVFFSFTDSLIGRDGKHYFGVATATGLYLFNDGGTTEGMEACGDLKRFRLRGMDYVHAFFSVMVFLTLTFGQSDVVRCFFPDAGMDMRQWLQNLPLGVGFVSSLVFIIFPTTRKGIGYSDVTPVHAAH